MSNHKTPRNFNDLRGKTFGRLAVVSRAPNVVTERGRSYVSWECVCECGKSVIVKAHNLQHGKTKSCGCLQREVRGFTNRTHGETVGGNSREYRAWRDIIARCTNPHVKCYPRYGGAGVYVCARWLGSFELFLSDMGRCPPKMTIDRIDGSKGYEPGNCRWATCTEQSRNRRYCKLNVDSAADVRRRHALGESYAELARSFGAAKSTIAFCCSGATWR
jgi:hypothetical protein